MNFNQFLVIYSTFLHIFAHFHIFAHLNVLNVLNVFERMDSRIWTPEYGLQNMDSRIWTPDPRLSAVPDFQPSQTFSRPRLSHVQIRSNTGRAGLGPGRRPLNVLLNV